jgi:nitroimidazol reductase NimA-like FMN-containing flavoprotein (pyridoxamine 5'-phosphate oxidase superfamily)
MLDATTGDALASFLAQNYTLMIATEDAGQPYVTRAFYVERPVEDAALTLYGTFITSSRKLANLRANPRVGLFIGPNDDTPTRWLEATALARVVEDEHRSQFVRDQLSRKSSVAAGFIARVPIVAVELQLNWMRLTDIAATPAQTQLVFATTISRD